MCIQVKRYMDAMEAGTGVAAARQKFLNFYVEVPNAEEFDQVDWNCFKELTEHVRNERTKEKKDKDREVCT